MEWKNQSNTHTLVALPPEIIGSLWLNSIPHKLTTSCIFWCSKLFLKKKDCCTYEIGIAQLCQVRSADKHKIWDLLILTCKQDLNTDGNCRWISPPLPSFLGSNGHGQEQYHSIFLWALDHMLHAIWSSLKKRICIGKPLDFLVAGLMAT